MDGWMDGRMDGLMDGRKIYERSDEVNNKIYMESTM